MNARTMKWLAAALLAVAALGGKARAAGVGSPSYLNIDVTVSASKSVSVNGVASSSDTSTTWTGTPNEAVVAPAAAAVKNDSGILTEGWQLSTNANSLTAGAQPWARVSSTMTVGADEFAVQAVFGSSNTASCAGASWNDSTIAPPLTTSGVQYATSGAFADSGLATDGSFNPDTGSGAGSKMHAYKAATGVGLRALCWRVIMPASTLASNNDVENIQVVVTAN